MTQVIDVHTHMLGEQWLDLLQEHGGPKYEVKANVQDRRAVFLEGAPFMTLQEGHFDYALRIEKMDQARVDLAVVTLTCPNVYWGGPEVSARAARIMNDAMAEAQTAYPDRIRWMASLPWQYPELALGELARACERGAVGVVVLANIAGRSLTEETFAPIWQAIDERALPVLVHPAAPPGVSDMDVRAYNLIAAMGFMFDTSLAVARMIFDGFLDHHAKLKLIAAHAGGTLPYLASRLDICFDKMSACRVKIERPPSEYLRRIYYDAVTYGQDALEMCLAVGGSANVMYGSDYPHNIGDMEGCLARVDALPDDQRKAVRGENARRIFDL